MAFELLYGTHDSTIDEKGRVIIPASLRERYQGELVVTQGNPQSVWVMLPEQFVKFQQNLKQKWKKINPEQYQLLNYLFISPARVAEIDKNSGRIPVTPPVRTYAGLINKKCMVISSKTRLEIWDSQCYYDYLAKNSAAIQDAINTVGSPFYDLDDDVIDAGVDADEAGEVL